MELVTGKAGVPHVSSADDGRRIAGEVGAGSYVLQTGGRLAPSLVDANTVRFATGDMIVQGRHIGLTAPEDVKVASGTQGKKRTDYICVHYKRDVSGANPTLVETCEWTVLQGTPGADATAPSVPAGSILNGDADVTVPVCSVSFDGLTTGEPKLLIGKLTPLATLGDSVDLYAESFIYGKPGDTTYAILIVSGHFCTLRWDVTQQSQTSWWMDGYTLPERMRPWYGFYAAGSHVDKNGYLIAGSSAYAYVSTDGRLNFNVATKVASARNVGSCTWPMRGSIE